jgi:hypothetical protein
MMTCSCGCYDHALPCGCCEGIEVLTPLSTANRPGLDAIAYRVGTHATFLESLMARLSSLCLDDEGRPCAEGSQPLYPLRDLTTRDLTDPAIALLDAWATVGDVLTFYQERIANEGYLRTATERRSVLELARLVGYRPRPGVAASVYLAFTLEDTHAGEVIIPAGARAQSLPAPPDLPQSFETDEPLVARAGWNRLRPRLYRQQLVTDRLRDLHIKGTGLGLRAGDRILIDPPAGDPKLCTITDVAEDFKLQQTKIALEVEHGTTSSMTSLTQAPAAWIDTALPAARIGTALPDGLGAGPLKALKKGLVDLGATAEQLDRLVARFAMDLVESFDLLAAMPQSAERDRAIAANRATLGEISALLLTMADRTPENALLREPLQWMANQTKIALDALAAPAEIGFATSVAPPSDQNGQDGLNGMVNALAKGKEKINVPPPTAYHQALVKTEAFTLDSDLRLRMTGALLHNRLQKGDLYRALRDKPAPSPSQTPSQGVFVLRATAAPFGHNAPPRPVGVNSDTRLTNYGEWKIDEPLNEASEQDPPSGDHSGTPSLMNGKDFQIMAQEGPPSHHAPTWLLLDAEYNLATGSRVVVDSPRANKLIFFTAGQGNVRQLSLPAYGLSGRSTALNLSENWFSDVKGFSVVRNTRVFLQSEELRLGLEPLPETFPCNVQADKEPANRIVLDGLHDGLAPGRWLIVAGERADLPGVMATELVMLQNIAVKEFDGANHTELTFSNELLHPYLRRTMTLYGNVARATHGETTAEALGSGDAATAWQDFGLRRPPLTYLAAPTPAGAAATLMVRVDDVRWREADNHVVLGPRDRAYVLEIDDDQQTRIVFGNGENGARPPTGMENIRAVYRTGIGQMGNVAADQIKLLATRPLGVKDVINPMRASGGAGAESRDSARRTAPLAVLALDRLVSVQDYADFSRTFAGVGKAQAVALPDGRREIIFLTIAGTDDIPIDKTSGLYRNLQLVLRAAGDPWQPVQIEMRELLALVVIANVRIHPDLLWEKVAPAIRARLYDTFSFERRELAQGVAAAEVISTIQSVTGVAYVDLDTLATISETDVLNEGQLKDALGNLSGSASDSPPGPGVFALPAEWRGDKIRPAQLAYLDPRVPDLLMLKELPT